jgi:hypothetical protein
MCKTFCNRRPHELWDYNVWSGKKSFFLCAQQGQQSLTTFGANFLNYSILRLYTISMHIMLGLVYQILEVGTSNSWRIFSEFTFSLDKIPMVDMKVLVWSNFSKKSFWNKMKSLNSMRNARFHCPKCRGQGSKRRRGNSQGLFSNLLIHATHLFAENYSTSVVFEKKCTSQWRSFKSISLT